LKLRCAAIIVFALPACSTTETGFDGGSGSDVRVDVIKPGDAAADVPQVCGPLDVSGYQPGTLTPPNAPHAYKCTAQQTSDYAQCQGAKVTALCKQFADGQPGQACRQCIETQTTDSRWGVIVFSGSMGRPNVEGCVDDALSQTSKEKANGGAGSCGDLLFASYGCQEAACAMCTGDAANACVSSALAGACKSFDQPVEATTGPCAVLLSDAPPADVGACFPDTAITDPTQQEVDWLTRIVGYMCGP
jgi:hypothetical protein